MLGETVGSSNISASGYLITRTRAQLNGGVTTTTTEYPETVITHIHLISSSTASNLTVSNGSGGTVWINITGVVSKGTDFDFGMWGISFPLGAYVTVDGNIVTATFTYKANKA